MMIISSILGCNFIHIFIIIRFQFFFIHMRFHLVAKLHLYGEFHTCISSMWYNISNLSIWSKWSNFPCHEFNQHVLVSSLISLLKITFINVKYHALHMCCWFALSLKKFQVKFCMANHGCSFMNIILSKQSKPHVRIRISFKKVS
jgi:hypothetical protein